MALLQVSVLRGGVTGIPPDLKLSTIDVAVGGSRCASNMRLEPDTRLQLTFTLEGGDLRQPAMVAVETLVLRCTEKPDELENRRYEVALKFVNMTPQDKKRLQSYLNSL